MAARKATNNPSTGLPEGQSLSEYQGHYGAMPASHPTVMAGEAKSKTHLSPDQFGGKTAMYSGMEAFRNNLTKAGANPYVRPAKSRAKPSSESNMNTLRQTIHGSMMAAHLNQTGGAIDMTPAPKKPMSAGSSGFNRPPVKLNAGASGFSRPNVKVNNGPTRPAGSAKNANPVKKGKAGKANGGIRGRASTVRSLAGKYAGSLAENLRKVTGAS